MSPQSLEYEYIVVGSGAGGGTVAARLAEAGYTVLLLEAGGDPLMMAGTGPAGPGDENRMPGDYHVPVFQAMATENTAMKWDFWIRHYADTGQQKLDPKYRETWRDEKVDGVLYPRAGTLGGCTAHNAMIMVYPHNDDWDDLAKLTGNASWNAANMRRYFERMEDCHHRLPHLRWLKKIFGWNPTRHGFGGWLRTEVAIPKVVFGDLDLVKVIAKSAVEAFKSVRQPIKRIGWSLKGRGDPNDWRLVKDNAVGIRYAPLTTRNHARTGTREFVRDVEKRYPDRLKIELDALVTRVVFDDANRAIGVEYQKGERLYRAHHDPRREDGEPREARASREVILSGGAFNTPQLLMLSGIGPKAHLEEHGIEVRVDLPGVGQNLQDRYEVGLVNRLKEDWGVLKDATFSKHDPQYRQWDQKKRKGVYTTNGAVLAVIKRSDAARPLPDLFIFATLGLFRGYFPGWSKVIADNKNYLTWVILKAHTKNTAGTVTLKSKDPRDRPAINFHYFLEGTDTAKEDIESVVDGLEFARKLTSQIPGIIEEEALPGKDLRTRAQLRDFVRDHAWGHHASCTCPIGPRDKEWAVLDSNFRVYGTNGLRVVDASVFPKIPGFFIVSSVYMIAEKAADVFLADAGHMPPEGGWSRWWRTLKAWLGGIWKWVWRIGAVVLLLLALIIGSSWFIFEPPPAEPDLEEEKQTINQIIAVLTGKLKDQYKDAPLALRDTHPKANACVKANVSVEPDLADNLSVGIFEGGRTYKAWIRFSNAADVVTPDTEEDFRGMAIKLFDVPGEKLPVPGDEESTQDLLFIAHDAFFAGSPRHFHDFFAACVAGGGVCDPLRNLPLAWHALTHPRGSVNALVGRRVYPNIEAINWFSVAPFRLGKDQVVKYGAFPCKSQVRHTGPGAGDDYLKKRLRDRLDPSWGGGLCLDLKVQVQVDPESQPIENTLIAWDPEDSPWQNVATIDIPPQKFTSDAQAAFCQNITYNPWHGLPAHEPLGGINRARRDVMRALQDVRLEANGQSRFEPTGEESFE